MSTTEAPKCSFCGASHNEYRRLVPGPEVYICNACVGQAFEAILRNRPSAAAPDTKLDPYCAFCGKKSIEVKRLAATDSARICDECLGDAFKILMEEDQPVVGAVTFGRVI